MQRILALGFGSLLLLSTALPAGGQEREEIVSYDVAIDVGAGGVMDVREEIRVRALGDRIRRGIFRDFPTGFPRWAGMGRVEAPFRVVSVTRNGNPERYALESVGGPEGRDGVRVRIGNPAVELASGIQQYVIRYETERWVEFGEDAHRLYWNVTGNGWGFPILSATARIHFEGVEARPTLESWTGPEGSTTSSATERWDPETATAIFETGAPLAPREGLTVRVSFPPGTLEPPSEAQREAWFRLDWGGWMDGAYLVLLVVGVYLLMWRKVGMDPPASRKGMRATPPEGYSPSALGFIHDRGYEQSQLSAALVNLALKGAVKLENEGDGWAVEKEAESDMPVEPLPAEEQALFAALMDGRTRVALEPANHTRLRKAIGSFRATLTRRFEREYFVKNRKWFAAGVAVSVLGLAALGWRWRFDLDPTALFLCVWLTGWTAGVGTLVYRVYATVRAALAGGGPAMWSQAGFLALFSVPFVGAEIFVFGMLLTMVPEHLAITAAVIGAVNILFYHLLERPTLKGQGLLDELDAFRAHLESAVDHARRTGTNAPAEQVREYERNLPYAIALGLEREWTEAFRDTLASAMAGAVAGGALAWYVRPHDAAPMDASSFASSLSSGLASTLTASSSRPTSSGGGGGGSSFSGGGSSGGGGGGGGGGGW